MDMPIAMLHQATQRTRNSTERRFACWLSALCAVLAGCASGTKHATLPSEGPTMAEIYRQHMSTVNRPIGGRDPIRAPVDIEINALQQQSVGDIAQRFVRLPNPDLVMYVTPHLAANGKYPVPGYSTVFPMFEGVHYALPGEVPWRRMSAAQRSDAPAHANAAR